MDAIPYHAMPVDDAVWYPPFLEGLLGYQGTLGVPRPAVSYCAGAPPAAAAATHPLQAGAHVSQERGPSATVLLPSLAALRPAAGRPLLL